MEKVLGIGGVFIRARDHEALAAWYREHLGLEIQPKWSGAIFPLRSDEDRPGAYVVWSAFPRDTEHLGPPEQACMVNFRVRDLHAMLAQLRAAGVTVDDHVEEGDYGRFGWCRDPEGNRIELWEPAETAPSD